MVGDGVRYEGWEVEVVEVICELMCEVFWERVRNMGIWGKCLGWERERMRKRFVLVDWGMLEMVEG